MKMKTLLFESIGIIMLFLLLILSIVMETFATGLIALLLIIHIIVTIYIIKETPTKPKTI